jgi:hypothetical protein
MTMTINEEGILSEQWQRGGAYFHKFPFGLYYQIPFFVAMLKIKREKLLFSF